MTHELDQQTKGKGDKKGKEKGKEKESKEDKYSEDILRQRYLRFKENHIELALIIEQTSLPIRHMNPPEDITENIAKYIIRNYDNDPSAKWAKSISEKGDLCSDKYPATMPPEVKSFISDGPSSFGPEKKFGVIYFLDLRNWLNDVFILWKVCVTSDSPEWKQMKMNKTQTNEDQCEEGRRPRMSWDNIHKQLGELCVVVYKGPFESIFTTTTLTDSL